jgi:hypothetical protein
MFSAIFGPVTQILIVFQALWKKLTKTVSPDEIELKNRHLSKIYPNLPHLHRTRFHVIKSIDAMIGPEPDEASFPNFVDFRNAKTSENPRLGRKERMLLKIGRKTVERQDRLNDLWRRLSKRTWGLKYLEGCPYWIARERPSSIIDPVIGQGDLRFYRLVNLGTYFYVAFLFAAPFWMELTFSEEDAYLVTIGAFLFPFLAIAGLYNSTGRNILLAHIGDQAVGFIECGVPYTAEASRKQGIGSAMVIQNYHRRYVRCLFPGSFSPEGFAARVKAYRLMKAYLRKTA